MLNISSPIHLSIQTFPEKEIQALTKFLNADQVQYNERTTQIDSLFLVGPKSKSAIELLQKRFSLNTNISLKSQKEASVAWGVWLHPDVHPLEAPTVQIFRYVQELGDRPVLISDYRLRPGELIVVTQNCDVIVTLFHESPLANITDWFTWISTSPSTAETEKYHVKTVTEKQSPSEPLTDLIKKGVVLNSPLPWLTDINSEITYSLTPKTPSFGITPLLPIEESEMFAKALDKAPWIRRSGDIYSQDSLDIIAWSQTKYCPHIVQQIVEQLQDSELVKRIAKLTGVSLTTQKELYAYRLCPGERILNHADGTCQNRLILRMNWLLKVSQHSQRPWDFRFWDPQKPNLPTIVYPAQTNQAVFFLMGEDTPHDVPVIPDNAEPRFNIIMTFG